MKPVKKLHPVIRATGFVSFFTDLGSEIVYPVLPIFLTQLGASRTIIGAIEGMAEGLPALIKLVAGSLSDRVRNRKWLVLTGYALSTLFKPMIALAHSAGFVFLIRLLDRVGKGIRTAPRDALIADYCEPSNRGHAFGFQRGMDHAGAMLGGILGFGLLLWLGSDTASLRQVIGWSFIPGILSVLVIIFFIHDKPDRVMAVKEAVAPMKRNPFEGVSRLPRNYFIYVGVASVFALANSSDAFLLLRAQSLGVQIMIIPLIWAFLHLVKSATSIWGGKLSDRIGRLPVLVLGWSLYAAVYAGFAFIHSPGAVWALFLAYGLFYGLTEGASKAVIADMIPAGQRGTAFGFWGMLEGVLLLAASLLTGWLWDLTGSPKVPLVLSGVLSLLAALFLLVWGVRSGALQQNPTH
jgi:MFS family permease